MVSLISLQAFFGLSVLLAIGLYLVYRRTDWGSAVLAVVGAGILALYLTVAIVANLTNVL